MFEKSKRSLRAATSGGSYRVRDSSAMPASTLRENSGNTLQVSLLGASQKAKTLAITVIFLDDSHHTFEVEKSAKGSVLLDKVFQHLELSEKDYFGLQFDELLPPPEVIHPLSSPHLRWVESSKQLKKQIRFSKSNSSKKGSVAFVPSNTLSPPGSSTAPRTMSENGGSSGTGGCSSSNGAKLSGVSSHCDNRSVHQQQQHCLPSATVYFRVKFFVEDPARLNEEYTRYHVFLQLRKDILEGRLVVTPSTACLLASYAVQSELGDFNEEEHDEMGYYLKNTEPNLLLLKNEDYLRKIAQLHKLHRGQTPADAEFNFLTHAKRLDAYGVNFHRVKDNLGKEILLGISSMGISVYHNGIKINTFSWSKITKIAFKRKGFFIQLRRELSEEYDTLLMFDCWSYRSCKKLWKSCVEHHAFFRLSAPPPPNRKPALLFLALGSRFRYSGRTEYQTREDASSRSQSRERDRERRTFFRSPSKKLFFLRQTLTGNKNRDDHDHPSNSPTALANGSQYHQHDGKKEDRGETSSCRRKENNRMSQIEVVARENNKENMDLNGGGSLVLNANGGSCGSQYYNNGVSQPTVQLHHPLSNGGLISNNSNSLGVTGTRSDLLSQPSRSIAGNVVKTNIRAYDKVHQSSSEKEPRQAWAEQDISDDEGGFLDRASGLILPPTSSTSASTSTGVIGASTPIPISLLAKGIAFADEDESSQSDDGTVSIRLEPDQQGKFGFNVKGGCDMGCPVLVSRVAPGTPADQGYPRLNEGDQLIQINGKDTAMMIHRDIVNSIRHAATVRKELVLRVRQNVYSTEDFEEPAFQYVPDIPLLHLVTGGSEDAGIQTALSSSMLLLAEALESDSISRQFELVFRRKPGLSCEVSKMTENVGKNRYRDITPYDSTRVILNSCPSGDYINANYVTMEIAASGIVNRYIATQGPLSSTSTDFWIMVWETQSPLIVMLTPIYEHGRVKCHQYWPQHLNSSVYHNLQVTTIQERNLPLWIHREFQIKNLETDEERVVVQLMYQSWPDHGVPDEPLSFIRFVEEVRKAKLGTVEPTIVHCSAGIGRTGVLILMETAECLIEANQPVYPLDVVTQMRLQRPLMIQTPSQYRFVCECVLKVYQKGMIRPLPEFCVQGNSPPNSMLVTAGGPSSLGSRAKAFCTSWFNNNIQPQQLHSAGSNA